MRAGSTVHRFFTVAVVGGYLGLVAAQAGPRGWAAEPSGSDRGLLFLSRATYLLRGEADPITQRGPVYGTLLAGLSLFTGGSDESVELRAREFGSTERFVVSTRLLEAPFLRWALLLNIAFFIATGLIIDGLLKASGVSQQWRLAAQGMYLVIGFATPIAFIHELTLSQFLLAIVTWLAFHVVAGRTPVWMPALLCGMVAGVAGLTRPTYQPLGLILAFGFFVLGWANDRRGSLATAVIVLLPSVVLIGGWSARNYARHGFFGVSSVLGSTLGAKTARHVERSQDAYPDLAPRFIQIRDEELVRSPEHTAALWSGGAVNLLMRERGLSYVEANRFMARVNLNLILHAPLRYFNSVTTGIVSHLGSNVPEGLPQPLRLALAALELAVIALFCFATAAWASLHLMTRWGLIRSEMKWTWQDAGAAMALLIFGTSVLLTCLVEAGRPEHRVPVQFVIPLFLTVIAYRMHTARRPLRSRESEARPVVSVEP